jgi:hypothetical protein
VTTLFTLFFIPSLYSVIEEHRGRRLPQSDVETPAADSEVIGGSIR